MSPHFNRIRNGVSLFRRHIQASIPPQTLKLIWRCLSALSLASIAFASYYAWRSLPQAELTIRPSFILLAAVIYVVAYITHLFGWHALARLFFGNISLSENIYAVASSSFVKYLPTVAWYIANRAHFYTKRQIPPQSVVAASFAELLIMTFTGSIFYLVVSLLQADTRTLLFSIGICIIGGFFIYLGFRSNWRKYIPARMRSLIVQGAGERRFWFFAIAWYSTSWPLGIATLWAVLHAFVPLDHGAILIIFNAWMITSIASYVLTISLGTAGIARDVTLAVLLARVWPLPIAVSAAIIVKVLLMLGEIVCSACIVGIYWISDRRKTYA